MRRSFHSLISAVTLMTTVILVASAASPPSPINCSGSPSLTVASFGEYVWNCSSSSTGGDGWDVLRIVVPSPPTVDASGLLSVEVRVGTFQQIIVDLGNVVRPQSNVNVTIVLCGAPLLGSPAINVLNLTDRPLTPAITITGSSNSSAPSSGSTTLGHGVLVAVVVDRDVQLWMRNVSGLVVVEPLSTNSSQLLDVTLELRSGCVVELHDVPYFVLIDSDRTRLVFSGFNATIQSTIAMPTSSSVAVLSVNASGGGGGSIDVGLTLCNISIVQLASPDASFLLMWGDAVSISNVAAAFTRCNISIPSPMGSVVAVRGNLTSTVTNLSVTCQDTIVYCDRSIVSISAVISVDAIDVAVIVRSSNVTVHGVVGALLYVSSSVQDLAITTVTIEMDSVLVFDGQGYIACFVAVNSCSASNLLAGINSSNVTVSGSVEALLYVSSPSGSVALVNNTATVLRSRVGFAVRGYVVCALSLSAGSMGVGTVAMYSSNVTVGGGVGALLYVSSSSGSVLLTNATVTLRSSIVRFAAAGYVVCASAVSNGSAVSVAITVRSSNLMVGGNIGAMMYLESSRGAVLLSNATAVVEGGSSVLFMGEGFLFCASAVQSCSASAIDLAIRSSIVTVRGDLGALLYVLSSAALSLLSSVTAEVDNDSIVAFSGEGYGVYAQTVDSGSGSCLVVIVRSSNVTVGGVLGALLYLQSTTGSALLFNITATVEGGSFVRFAGAGILIYLSAASFCSLECVALRVWLRSFVTVSGDGVGAVIYIEATTGGVLVANTTATVVGGSTVGFAGEGYLVYARAVSSVSSSCVATAVRGSKVTVGGSLGALFFAQSSNGSVLLSNITTLLEGDGIVGFGGNGYLTYVVAMSLCSVRFVTVSVGSSGVTMRRGAALVLAQSTNGSVLASNIAASVDGSTVDFRDAGILIYASAGSQCTASNVTVAVRASNVTVIGSVGALFSIRSSNGSVLVVNVTAAVEGGSAVGLASEGYLVSVSAVSSVSASSVAIAVRSSRVTVRGNEGALLSLQGGGFDVRGVQLAVIGSYIYSPFLFDAHPAPRYGMQTANDVVVGISVANTVMLVTGLLRSPDASLTLGMVNSTIVVTGSSLLSLDVSGVGGDGNIIGGSTVPTVALTMSNCMLVVTLNATLPPQRPRMNVFSPFVAHSNVTFVSRCGLIGRRNNNSSIMEWARDVHWRGGCSPSVGPSQ